MVSKNHELLPLKNDFVVTPLEEMSQLTTAADDHCANLFGFSLIQTYLTLDRLALLLRELLVVLVHSCLAVSADE